MKNEVKNSYDCEQLFANNPELAYLPNAAAERGMYGAFILGSIAICFVFGYDRELIENGDFIEVDSRLYPKDEFMREHRLAVAGQGSLVAKRYNAVSILMEDCSIYNTKQVINWMNALEQVKALCDLFGFSMPEYFNYSKSFAAVLDDTFSKIKRASGLDRQRYLNQFKGQFISCFRTTYNARPEDEDCNLADYIASPYCVDNNPKVIEKIFRNRKDWRRHLFNRTKDYADNPDLTGFYVRSTLIPFLEKVLDKFHVPYEFAAKEKVTTRFMKKIYGTSELPTQRQIVIIPTSYANHIDYFIRAAHIDSSMDSLAYENGEELFRSGCFYGFCAPLASEIISKLIDYGVVFYALPDVHLRYLIDYTECYFIAPLSQKPLIDAILKESIIGDIYTHYQSVSDTFAASEKRIPKWQGGHQVMYCNYGNQRGALNRAGTDCLTHSIYDYSDISEDSELKRMGVLTEPVRSGAYDGNRKILR